MWTRRIIDSSWCRQTRFLIVPKPNVKSACINNVIDPITPLPVAFAYKERFLDALMFFAERILNADLGEKHFLSRVVGRVLHHFQVFANYKNTSYVSEKESAFKCSKAALKSLSSSLEVVELKEIANASLRFRSPDGICTYSLCEG